MVARKVKKKKQLRRTKNLMNYVPVYKSFKLELLPMFLYL